jgi:hypothetical protein
LIKKISKKSPHMSVLVSFMFESIIHLKGFYF